MKIESGSLNVVDAAYMRMRNFAESGLPFAVAFSGGKDSLVVGQIIVDMIEGGEIEAEKVTWSFVDEEAMFPCVIKIVEDWREKVLALGCKFVWWALPFLHFNAFNNLEEEDTWRIFDPMEKENWVRNPPDFAIRSHPDFRPNMKYQDFFNSNTGGISVLGLRGKESVQRGASVGKRIQKKVNKNNRWILPVYDWSDRDVWKFLSERKVDIPDAYMFMYQVGVSRRQLRLSTIFGIDVAHHLVHMVEFYPGLYDAVLRRVPNAYLAMYYFDSEMFRRNTARRRELESGGDKVDWRAKTMALLNDERYSKKPEAHRARTMIKKYGAVITEGAWQRLYTMVYAGDPKARTSRAIYTVIRATGGKPKNEKLA